MIDAAAEERLHNIEQVEEVLAEIGAAELPELRVYNKIDLLGMEPRIDRDDHGKPIAVWLSAQTGQGVELLMEAISDALGREMVAGRLQLKPEQGRLRAKLYQQQAVADEQHGEDGSVLLEIRLPKSDLMRLLSAENLRYDELHWADGDDSDRIAC